jgi:Ca-activated chloride channel homolog
MLQGRRVFFIISLILSLVFLQIACSKQSSAPNVAENKTNPQQTTNSTTPTTSEPAKEDNKPVEMEAHKPQTLSMETSKNEKVAVAKRDKSKGTLDAGVEGGVVGGVAGGVIGGVIGGTGPAADPPPPPPPPPAAASSNVTVTKGLASPNSVNMAVSPATSSVARPQPQAVPEQEYIGSEDYTKYSINKMTDTKKDNLSTFSIDVDTGSYTIARRKLNEGYLPPAQSVRVEEFINYFQYKYPQPATEHPFSVSMEASASPFNQNRHLLRIGIKGRTVEAQQRPNAHLTFLVDTSGSMQSADKIGLVKDSLRMLVENLRPTDTVAITTYAGGIRLVLPPTSAANKDLIIKSLYQLEAGGGTAMESGIQLAYQQALAQLNQSRPGDINRVIICSDGDANIGNTSPTQILAQIQDYVKRGITVTTMGFGMGNYKDSMMEQFANKGNGNYFYIDGIPEARRIFSERLTSNLQVIAKDVKIQVEFDPSTVSKYRLVGYENRDIADKDFRNDKVDAGEIGPGHTVTALYELELNPQRTNNIATVRLRYKAPNGETAKEVAVAFTADRVQEVFNKTSEDYRFTVAVAAFAEVLRGSKEAKSWSLDSIANIARSANSLKIEERQEFLSLINRTQKLRTHLTPQ